MTLLSCYARISNFSEIMSNWVCEKMFTPMTHYGPPKFNSFGNSTSQSDDYLFTH